MDIKIPVQVHEIPFSQSEKSLNNSCTVMQLVVQDSEWLAQKSVLTKMGLWDKIGITVLELHAS